jgi:HemY protein
LYLEAARNGDQTTARGCAEQAHKLSHTLDWAGMAVFEDQAARGEWTDARATLQKLVQARIVEKKDAKRLRAVLLTAEALEREDGAPQDAESMSLEAHSLAPELVPASVVAGRLLSRRNDYRKAAKVLEATWKLQPHPELADVYIHLRPGDAAQDRLKRARRLDQLCKHALEGAFAVARAAIDAREFSNARDVLKPFASHNPTQRLCLMMAELEEADTANIGPIREWLARAVHAKRDPAWTADGYISAHWAPVSPLTGKLDAFEWKVPIEQVEGDEALLLQAEDVETAIDNKPVALVPKPENADDVTVTPEPEPVSPDTVIDFEVVEETQEEEAHEEDTGENKQEKNVKSDPRTRQPESAKENEAANTKKAEKNDSTVVFPLSHAPDDPGPRSKTKKPEERDGPYAV